MPKGVAQKQDFVKAGENPFKAGTIVPGTDVLSTVDKGHDFVKAGENAQVGH